MAEPEGVAKAEEIALGYVKTWRDVEDPEIKATKIVYIWRRAPDSLPVPPNRGTKCLQVSGSFHWVPLSGLGGNGSFAVLVDASGRIRGYSSTAGKVRSSGG